ncbi:MAG: SDR family oxidoreductase [Gemmatimonadaceae bacterium]|nr:SDR family oxidoreductase [Gemmatimonadaceae bacterium]
MSHPIDGGELRVPGADAELAGSIVVVTGASTGIGRAIALAMARAGADVAITYRSEEDAAHAVAAEAGRLGRRARVFQLDLAHPSSIARLADDVRSAFGRVDVWVNNAGADILTGAGAALSIIEKLDLLLTVDLRGTVLASWEAVRIMREQGTGGVILNMSWDHALTGMSGRNPEMFSAAKGGILSFSKSLARSVAPDVRVNILAPGWIETEFGSELDREHYQRVVASTPLKRWGTPEDVAAAAVFLASPRAAFLTGQTLLVGGGIVM